MPLLELRERSRLGLLTGLALAVLLLAPLLGSGYVLTHDMVFVPRTPLGGQLLGLDGVPRGVPSELVVALLSRVLSAAWLQDLLLFALVVAGAWGAARLAPTSSRAGAVAAATTYGWCAYLHERLLLGQWAVLLGWAVLPWAVRASLDWRRGGSGWWAVGPLSIAALGGANSLLVVALAVVVCGRPVRALLATLVLSLPWAVPALLQHVVAGDPRGVSAFAASSDTGLGLLGSLLTGGGVWSSEAVPAGRNEGSVAALLVLLVALVGIPLLTSRLGNRLLLLASVGLVLSLLGHVFGAALRWAVVHVPAAGLLRDGQRWVVLLEVAVAAGAACGTEVLLARVPQLPVRRVAAGLLVLAPLAALPGAAWAEDGTLTASHYPSSWGPITRQAHGTVLVLPWSLYRAFPWTQGRTVLDPASKLLERPVVNDSLPLPGYAVRGEDPVAAGVSKLVTSGQPLATGLRAAGITQLLVEKTTAGYDGDLVARQTAGLTRVATSSELDLFDIGSGATTTRVSAAPVVLADLVALALALTAWVQCVRLPQRPEA